MAAMTLPNLDEHESNELHRLLKKLLGLNESDDPPIQVDPGRPSSIARVVIIPVADPSSIEDSADAEIRVIDIQK
jgi:hypothetical protein